MWPQQADPSPEYEEYDEGQASALGDGSEREAETETEQVNAVYEKESDRECSEPYYNTADEFG